MRARLFLCLIALFAAVPTVALAANIANVVTDNGAVVANDAVPVVATPTPAPSPTVVSNGNTETDQIAAGIKAPPGDVTAAGSALLQMFVLAVVLERALALLFNWRPFVATFDGGGIKTPIALAVALLVMHYFQPDAMIRLFQAYGNPLPDEGGQFIARTLEAMVVAGGSAGVSKLMQQLGFQSPLRAEDVRPKPKSDDEAWISVALDGDRGSMAFPSYVLVTPAGGAETEVGTIYQFSGPQSFRSYFFRNRGRFPQSGGYAVTPGITYTIAVVDRDGKRIDVPGTHTLGPRAIIDIVVKA